MRSASDTKRRQSLNHKVSLLIALWILDKLIMILMFIFL
jgi:hypothetical protein